MVANPIRTAATAENGVVEGTLLEAMVKRFGYVLNVGESLGDLEFDVGEPPLLVFSAATGYGYFYDATDSTTPDDGLTTLVTGNGLRYAIGDAVSLSLNSVLDVVTVPTGSEVVGDAYIVDAAATGAFSGQDDNLAYLTRRGWIFAAPEIGHTVFNVASGRNTQFSSTGWGAFPVEFADGSIPPTALEYPGGLVVEDTLNAPPGSPTTGKLWIVGNSPTGDFTGHTADIAFWTGTAWDFMDPADGWSAYHKANGFEVFFLSGDWLGASGSDYQEFSTPGAATWTKPAKGNMAIIECWGAGGSGGRGGNSQPRAGGGGGGGSYSYRMMPMAELASSVTVTVGAGGAAMTGSPHHGNAGGNSSFGSHVVGYGGGGGAGNASSDNGQGGGGGGGMRGAGASVTSTTGGVGGINGFSVAAAAETAGTEGGGGGGGSGQGGPGGNGGSSGLNYGGGGGGAGRTTGTAGTNVGGNAIMAGAGGGGGNDDSAAGAGGTSFRGGNGGAGANGSNAATAGAQPGGGGGGSAIGNSGKGGDGRVRVTVF